MDPVGGALLGLVFQELYTTIKLYMHPSLTRASTLRSKLAVLAGKVEPLSRRFAAIDARYPDSGAHREALKLREMLEKADALVRDCGGIRWWNLRRKRRFSKRLTRLDASLGMLLSVDFGPGVVMGRLMTIEAQVVEMNAKLDRMYVGRQVGPAPPLGRQRSGGGGRRGMRVEVRYERTEKRTCLNISVCWGHCCGGHDNDDDDEDGDRRGDYRKRA
ncbi:unnamed protein product [Linum tenue]|uniref:RPW8 domain-containing protein n=2 Tax=Linum tenue TaxID=586396 RepID=A0AAV0R9I1_9ROSI|nr:unnamed protein product [Linum tenue]